MDSDSFGANFADISNEMYYGIDELHNGISSGSANEYSDLIKSSETRGDKLEPIAVVGFALKFPQDATSAESFWQMLADGRSAMTDIPKDRFNIDAFYNPSKNMTGVLNAKGGHFIRDDLAGFDAPFFSISPAEAACMDPQQRWLLETSYLAFENAGLTLDQINGSNTSVYIGSFLREYEVLLSRDPELPLKYKSTGVGAAMLANRLSWFYNLKGPSIALDTACSSSLNALHLACQSLRAGESSMGLVGGCNLFYNPDTMVGLSDLNFLSPDSKCYSFDHRANGYARGEGFGIVIVKRLVDAVQNGDAIRAVIRATGSNQDGRTPGITQPSSEAQEKMICQTYKDGDLDMGVTRYFEAHGTGTPLGDPLEAKAIYSAFKDKRPQNEPLYVGAVKSNIGHLEGASGLAGLIKTILVLEKGIIPPNIWFERPNPKIPVKLWNIEFPVENIPWPVKGLRRASVSSFGFGGSNAHVVLDDTYNYLRQRNIVAQHCTQKTSLTTIQIEKSLLKNCNFDNQNTATKTTKVRLIVWSASDLDGLQRMRSAYRDYFYSLRLQDEDSYLDNLAYTLAEKRTRLLWKSYKVTSSLDQLRSRQEGELSNPVQSKRSPRLGFVFTGQGAQWFSMGRELMFYPIFRKSLEESENFFFNLGCTWSLTDMLYVEAKKSSKFDDPLLSQPICTALQIALVDLLLSWNVNPSTVVGHSSGEIAAAFCTGNISRESALKLAYYRGLSTSLARQQNRESEAMISVGLSADEIEPYISAAKAAGGPGQIHIACLNSPKNTTLSGVERQIDFVHALLNDEGIFARKLKVDVAYHSDYMHDAASIYRMLIHDIKHGQSSATQPAMVSSVTGRRITADILCDSEYWIENLISVVKFSDAIHHICSQSQKKLGMSKTSQGQNISVDCFLEIGPHSTLQGPLREILGFSNQFRNIGYLSVLNRGKPASITALEAAGQLHCMGFLLNLRNINDPYNQSQGCQVLTQLPAYPFNHSKGYWLESRISKNFRFREHPHHELLGTRSSDWNPIEAKWNNRLILSEKPWIKDHKVNGVEVYPAAGMVVMAIEAARQMRDITREVKGYRLRDIAFNKPLIMSSSPEGTETQLFLRPVKDMGSKFPIWNEFRLCVHENGEWIQCCRGAVSVEYQTNQAEFDGYDEWCEEKQELCRRCERGFSSCNMTMNSRRMYEIFNRIGLDYGPTFQSVDQVHFNDDGEANGLLDTCHWMSHVSDKQIQTHVIHPTALDAIFQLAFPALTKGGKDLVPTMVPSQMQNLWISDFNSGGQTSNVIKVHTSAKFQGHRSAEISFATVDVVSDSPCVVGNFEMIFVSDHTMLSSNHQLLKQLCYNIDWKPDIDMMEDHQILAYCSVASPDHTVGSDCMIDEKEFMCFMAISQALNAPQRTTFAETPPHIKKYVEWMRLKVSNHFTNNHSTYYPRWMDLRRRPQNLENIGAKLEKIDPEGKLIMRVSQNLSHVLEGKLDALELFFQDSLLQEYYRSAHNADSVFSRIAVYIDLLAHKRPGLRILEIGAGTGSITSYIHRTLTRNENGDLGTPRLAEYMFTDISPSFFEQAAERFKSDRMAFATLDIEKDPAQQGFEIGKYDLVIAANVLHATANLDRTLQNTRKLLKPDGKMVLYEGTNPKAMRTSFIFGLLPGWWLGTEKDRQWGPLITQEEWQQRLVKNQFTGVDFKLDDSEDENNQMCTAMFTTASQVKGSLPPTLKIIILKIDGSHLQHDVSFELKSRLETMGFLPCEVFNISQTADMDWNGVTCIFLPELELPLLHNVTNELYIIVQRALSAVHEMLWITHSSNDPDVSPTNEMIAGLSRCIRTERADMKFITLALQDIKDACSISKRVISVFKSTIIKSSDVFEAEYTEKNGVLCINRVIQANALNEFVTSKTTTQRATLQKFGQDKDIDRALNMSIGSVGLLDTLQFVDDVQYPQPLLADEIEIETKAIGVNFRDVLVALGQVSSSYFGNECAGIVTRVGASASLEYKAGDRITCGAQGSFKTYARCNVASAHKIPPDMAFATAAALPVVFTTAYYALMHWARISKGESVLIHSGAGGVGQAAIQLAQLVGTEIFVTVGTKEKKRMIMNRYGIPDDHIFTSRDLSFAKGIKRLTSGRGVDVVLNSLAGEGLRSSWESIAPFGRFIEIGKKDIYTPGVSALGGLSMMPFAKNVMFASVDLAMIIKENNKLMRELMKAIMSLACGKKIFAPEPLQVYGASQVEEAFRFMQSGKHSGKIVIEVDQDDTVPVVPSLAPTYQFSPNATYLISGGLGGLGRSITRWMADRGARHFVLLSRSRSRNADVTAFVKNLIIKGINIATPPCDISDEKQLTVVLEECSETMPPIKGCVQASMVLKNKMFADMTIEDFKAAVKPKVEGSWNLHKHLPNGMDFFILLASYAGIVGSHGQSNYAVGNTYQDALARHRVAHGEKAVAIDLGAVQSVGMVSEHPELANFLEASGHKGIQEAELLAILEYYCNPGLTLTSPLGSQIVTCLESPVALRAQNLVEQPWMSRSLFGHLHYMDNPSSLHEQDPETIMDFDRSFRTAESLAEVGDQICDAIRTRLSKLLAVEKDSVDPEKPMHVYGVDSLVAVEIRNWFSKAMSADIAVFEILGNYSIAALGLIVAKKSQFVPVSLKDDDKILEAG